MNKAAVRGKKKPPPNFTIEVVDEALSNWIILLALAGRFALVARWFIAAVLLESSFVCSCVFVLPFRSCQKLLWRYEIQSLPFWNACSERRGFIATFQFWHLSIERNQGCRLAEMVWWWFNVAGQLNKPWDVSLVLQYVGHRHNSWILTGLILSCWMN